jgi:hypothetical protein
MTRILTSLCALALLVGTSAAAPPVPQSGGEPSQPEPAGPPPVSQSAGYPSPAATTDPAMLARAKNWFEQLQAGKIDRSQLEPNANSNLTDATIANAQSLIGNLGTPVSFVQDEAGTQGAISYAIYTVSFKSGKKVNFLFAVDPQGKVAGLSLGNPH